MNSTPYKSALIIGAGPGISTAFATALAAEGIRVGLAARNIDKLGPLVSQFGAQAFQCDATDPAAVEELFAAVELKIGAPDIVLYNASARAHGPVAEIDPEAVRSAIMTTAFGGFLAVRAAAQRMVPQGYGAILLTGASASVKGFSHSAAFAMGKFALRGLAQSAARELGPKGVHVAHFIIDGGVRSELRPDALDKPDGTLDPDAIATVYMHVLKQPRNAWSFEVDLRPWRETF